MDSAVPGFVCSADVDPDGYRFVISKRLKEDYDNGKVYYQLHGSQILLPEDPRAWPSREGLRKHTDSTFDSRRSASRS
jgi:putative restriction endonuclease